MAVWVEVAREALKRGKVLELRYDGFVRCVEVHAVGYTKDQNAVMRVWQVRGGSQSGARTPWRLLSLDEAIAAHVTDEPSGAPRPGYKRGDKDMVRIVCEV